MLPTSTATATTPPNPIHNGPTTCEYLMECVMSVINCVREFFASLCTRRAPPAAAITPPADPDALPANMSFDRMQQDYPQLETWLSSTDNHLKLEIRYLTSDGILTREYTDVNDLQCRCYCDLVFECARFKQWRAADFAYKIQITITRPAQNENEKDKSLRFNWHNATITHPSGVIDTLKAPTITPTTSLAWTFMTNPKLRNWLANGNVNLTVRQLLRETTIVDATAQNEANRTASCSNAQVIESRNLNEASLRAECSKYIEETKKFEKEQYYLQFTFTKADSPNDTITVTWQNIYPQL